MSTNHKYIDCPPLSSQEKAAMLERTIEKLNRAKHNGPRLEIVKAQPMPAQQPPAAADSVEITAPNSNAVPPLVAALWASWEELTPGCSARPGVAEVRAMVRDRSLIAPPQNGERLIKGKISF